MAHNRIINCRDTLFLRYKIEMTFDSTFDGSFNRTVYTRTI